MIESAYLLRTVQRRAPDLIELGCIIGFAYSTLRADVLWSSGSLDQNIPLDDLSFVSEGSNASASETATETDPPKRGDSAQLISFSGFRERAAQRGSAQ